MEPQPPLAALLATCILLVSALPLGARGADGRFAHALLRALFENYSSAVRPVSDNTNSALNVTLQITLSQIIDMDERNQILAAYLWVRQMWRDAYLSWDREQYDGLDTLRIPSSLVWKPDIVLYNNADDEFTRSMETNVVLRHTGDITWDQPSITRSSCGVDVSYFPFDAQQCHLTFGSWTYNGHQVDIFPGPDNAELKDFVANVEWEILGMAARRNVIVYGCCSEPYPDITYTITLKRRSSFYIFNLLLPCLMISFLAPLGFYLPADSGEKVSLGVTVLLALTVFQLLVAESMPPSENMPLIGKYYIATMSMITASTALTIFVMNMHHCGPEARPVPAWARVLVLHYLARAFFVYEVGENCRTARVRTAAPATSAALLDTKEWEDEAPEPLDAATTAAAGRCRRCCCCCCCAGTRGGRVARDVASIAAFVREARAAHELSSEWKKVAKVMDRVFMWIFFLLVFCMSLLIAGKAM
ncbi:LOW QUALITY PROTEIN: neuronal acetylcholine receptor subunit alpha-10-like [Lampetra fluviatilis]